MQRISPYKILSLDSPRRGKYVKQSKKTLIHDTVHEERELSAKWQLYGAVHEEIATQCTPLRDRNLGQSTKRGIHRATMKRQLHRTVHVKRDTQGNHGETAT